MFRYVPFLFLLLVAGCPGAAPSSPIADGTYIGDVSVTTTITAFGAAINALGSARQVSQQVLPNQTFAVVDGLGGIERPPVSDFGPTRIIWGETESTVTDDGIVVTGPVRMQFIDQSTGAIILDTTGNSSFAFSRVSDTEVSLSAWVLLAYGDAQGTISFRYDYGGSLRR